MSSAIVQRLVPSTKGNILLNLYLESLENTNLLTNLPTTNFLMCFFSSEFDTCMRMTSTREQDLKKVHQEGYADWVRKNVLSDRDCDIYIRQAD